MGFETWREAVSAMKEAAKAISPEQLKLAKLAGITITENTPRIVAAAMLRVALRNHLLLPAARPVSEYLSRRLTELRLDSRMIVTPKNDEEAEAWVAYFRLVRRIKHHSKLKLAVGDVVQLTEGEKAEVTSIDFDGRVFFKGRGQRTWPDLIDSVAARKDDNSAKAKKAKNDANNAAALRGASPEWSAAKSEDLAEFLIVGAPTEDDIDELEVIIAGATDERPIQQFLQRRSQLLAALLGGKERFCIPQKRLGAEYVPDFVIGDVDSMGIRWVLVELETPKSGIYITNGKTLDRYAQKGVDQISDWRHWLKHNIAYAHKPRLKEGLGLADMSNQTEALVLVGRRAMKPRTKDARRLELKESNNTQVHTYDWLLETLRAAIRFDGPPASNPYLIPKEGVKDWLG